MKKYVIYLLISLIIGCGGSNYQQTVGPVKESTIYDIVKDGWYYYENEEYTLALSKFDRAIKINNQYADAYNGLGWTYLGLQNISLSLSNFEKMTNLNENLMDGWASLSLKIVIIIIQFNRHIKQYLLIPVNLTL